MEETEKELTEAKQKLAELQAQSEARQEPQKTLTLDEAISLVRNSPREEPEFVEQWEKHNRILAAGIILARAGLSDEDFTLEQIATFGNKCAEKMTAFKTDGKIKYPEKVDMSKATLKTLKRLEVIMEIAKDKIDTPESVKELESLINERTALLKTFWVGNEEFGEWEQTLVVWHVLNFKVNLGKN